MKITKLLVVLFGLGLGLSLASCSGCGGGSNSNSSESESTSESSGGLFDEARKSIDALEEATEKAKSGETAEVDMEALKDWVPDEVLGLKRTNREITKSGVMGIQAVTIKGTYGEGSERVELEAVHFGGFQPFINTMAAWSQMDIYKEGDNYYEKTVKDGDMKSFVKFNFDSENGEYSTLTEDYIVTLKTRGFPEKKFKDAYEDLKINRLPKPKPVK